MSDYSDDIALAAKEERLREWRASGRVPGLAKTAMEAAAMYTASQAPVVGNGKLEIGEVWHDGADMAAPRMERLLAEPSAFETATPAAPGRKDDAGKPRWDLLPSSIRSVVDVITYGAGKYGDNNWRSLAKPHARYGAAAFRHLTAWLWGERCDPESGLPHLAHAATNMLFLLELER